MLRSRLDRVIFRVIAVIFIVVGIVYGGTAYGRYLRHSLIVAARSGDLTAVNALLNRGVDPNANEPGVNSLGPTSQAPSHIISALDAALINQHYEIAGLLLQKGA